MARSDSLKNLTSALTRVENAFKAVADLPPGDRARVLEWAEEEVIGPMQAELTSSK